MEPKKIVKSSTKVTKETIKATPKKPATVSSKKLMTLFGYWRSGATWRVRLALFLKGFSFDKDIEYIPVDLAKGDQHKDNYARLNPAKVRSNYQMGVIRDFLE